MSSSSIDGDSPPPSITKPEAKKESREPPNGGLDAWLCVLGTFLSYMSTWGLLNAYGSYAFYYQNELLSNRSTTDIVWVGTAQAVLIIILGVVTGPLYDRGYIRSLLAFGSFLVVFGMMMTSLSTKYYQIMLAQGVCVGIGSGITYVPCLAMVASMFTTKRPIAIALATSGAAIGGVIYPIVLQRLLPRIGFAWATRVLGFLALATFLGAILIMFTRPKPPKPAKVRSYLDMTAFEEPAFVFFCITLFLMFWAYYVPFFFIPTFASELLAASSDFSVYLLAITNAATLVGRILSAFVAQKFGAPGTVAFYALGCGILLFGWIGIKSLAAFDVWVVIFGLFAGPLVTIPAAVVPLVSPDLGVVGTRLGMVWAAAALGGLIGSPVAGFLNGPQQKDFLPSQIMVGTVMVASAAFMGMTWALIVKQQRAGCVFTWRGRRPVAQ